MINLVPEISRKAIVKEYWIRVVSVFLFILSVVSLASLLLILPVYVLVSEQVDVFASSAAEAEKRVSQYDLSAGEIKKANGTAQKIFELRELKKFSDIFEQVLRQEGAGIKINGFSFNRKEKLVSPVQVTGTATTRQVLAAFREELLKQENIVEVILPISNLAKDKDIEFTISIVLKEVNPANI